MKTTVVPFFIPHFGCPHRCIFCNQERITGAAGLPCEAEILGRIREYRRTSGASGVEAAFYGGSFTCLHRSDQERLLQPLQPFLETGEVRSVRVSTRPDAIDADRLSYLRSMGVTTVELGVQSMDDNVLELSRRGHTAREVVSAVSCLRAFGMRVGLQLMPGLPGDNPHISLKSMSSILSLVPDFIRIYPALVIAGTRLERDYADGRFKPMSLETAVTLCKVMLHRAMKASIPVIRLGLPWTANPAGEGAIVAGPWHPAFRQMVDSELCYDLLAYLAGGLGLHDCRAAAICHPSRISDVTGHRRANVVRLHREKSVSLQPVRGAIEHGFNEITLEMPDTFVTGCLTKDLNYTTEDAFHA
jgi:histone acetyltransferase (RNA polymerase elongator complex component)